MLDTRKPPVFCSVSASLDACYFLMSMFPFLLRGRETRGHWSTFAWPSFCARVSEGQRDLFLYKLLTSNLYKIIHKLINKIQKLSMQNHLCNIWLKVTNQYGYSCIVIDSVRGQINNLVELKTKRKAFSFWTIVSYLADGF